MDVTFCGSYLIEAFIDPYSGQDRGLKSQAERNGG